jgi:hypothetical protein
MAGTGHLKWAIFVLAQVPGSSSIWGAGETQNATDGVMILHGPRP